MLELLPLALKLIAFGISAIWMLSIVLVTGHEDTERSFRTATVAMLRQLRFRVSPRGEAFMTIALYNIRCLAIPLIMLTTLLSIPVDKKGPFAHFAANLKVNFWIYLCLLEIAFLYSVNAESVARVAGSRLGSLVLRMVASIIWFIFYFAALAVMCEFIPIIVATFSCGAFGLKLDILGQVAVLMTTFLAITFIAAIRIVGGKIEIVKSDWSRVAAAVFYCNFALGCVASRDGYTQNGVARLLGAYDIDGPKTLGWPFLVYAAYLEVPEAQTRVADFYPFGFPLSDQPRQ